MKTPQFQCACASARHIARTLTQLYDGALRESGLEAPQFALLMTLEHAGPCTQAALAEAHALDKTTVSRNVRWLERQGWIATSVGADRRSRQLTLTTAGRRRLAAAKPKWRAAQDRLRAQMSGSEWSAMFAAFRSVEAAAGRAKRGA
jgi:DNA-binding MarR family transcriptional regulator